MIDNASDVLVIGGGVMGLTTAWQLAQRGVSVTILEQGRCGKAASHAALGALWPPPMARAGALQQLHRKSLWGYEAFVQSLQAASGLHVHYQRRGKVELMNSAEAFHTAAQQCEAANTSWPLLDDKPVMELLTSAQARQYEPHISDAPHGAHLCRWSGQVNVDQLLEALVTACMRGGVRILEGMRVDRLECDANRIIAAHSAGQKFVAEKCVLCAGIGMPAIASDAPLSPPITPVKGQALLLRVRNEVVTHIVKSGMIFLVPWQDGRILVGSTTEPEAGFDTTNTAEGIHFLLQGATQIVPALKSAVVERVWAGLRPTGPKHRPVMGKSPAFDNVFVCAGHFKIGIGLAPLAAAFMAELITTGRVEPGMEAFALPTNAQ